MLMITVNKYNLTSRECVDFLEFSTRMELFEEVLFLFQGFFTLLLCQDLSFFPIEEE